jgi:hypothetical protein
MRGWMARFVTPQHIALASAVGLALAASCSRTKHPTATNAGGEGGTVSVGEAGGGRGGSRALGGREAMAGEAGAGVGASQGGATVGTLPSWLAELDDWQSFSTLPECSVHVARDAAKVSPRHVFTPCGDGCEVASVLPGDTPGLAYTLGTAARASSAGLTVSLSQVLASEPATSLVTTYTFGEGQPNLLMLVRGNCRTQMAGRASPQLLYVFPPAGEAIFKVGWLEGADSKVVQWLGETTTRLLSAFDYGSSWGGIEGFAETFVAETPLSVSLTSVHQAQGLVTMAAGDLGLAVWGEWSGAEGRVLGFAPGKPVAAVATGSWYPALVGVSSTRLAWLGASGPNVTDGTYESARVYWCTRTSALQPCTVTEGPALPIRAASGVLAVYDRWLALTACATDGSGCDIYLVDTSAGTAHRLTRVSQEHGVQVIGVSGDELFAADFAPAERGTPSFGHILRYNLAKLGSFSVQL